MGEVCTVFSAKRVHQSDWQKEGIPFYRAREIVKLSEQGYVDNDLFISEMLYEEYISTGLMPAQGDVMISAVGTIGKTYIVRAKDRFYFKDASVLCLKNPCLIPAYLDLYLQSTLAKTQMQYGSKGTTVDTITIEKASDYLIPIPPSEEQKRIVSYLDTMLPILVSIESQKTCIDNLIDKAKNRILNLAIKGNLVPQNPSDEPAINLLRRIYPDFKPSDNLHYGERLPSGWTCGSFGDLNQHRNKSEDPLASPEEEYELYSVPIYDTGMPEYLLGKEIGSTKQIVDKGDVLLCKINPHLNRSWVVSHYCPELKCIASSEWLVFRSAAIFPDYARLFFMSPAFKSLMLSNVSGVGGSLMRARASAVNSYPIWIPPINEQKRIVRVAHQLNATIELIASILE